MNLFRSPDFKSDGTWFSGQAIVLTLLWMFCIAAQAQSISGTTGSGLIYSADSGQITVTGYDDSGTDLSIPAAINVSGTMIPVVSISGSAFFLCNVLATVTVPASVTSVGNDGLGAINLTAITVDAANPVYSSVNGVFFDKAQTTLLQYPEKKAGSSYTIPDGVTRIEWHAFYYCQNLTSVTIPSSVTSLADRAFFQDFYLTGITLPSNLVSIGLMAFSECVTLTSVMIPASVTSIGDGAFSICDNLSSAVFLGNDPGSFGTGVFAGTASGFHVYYFVNSFSGFTSPTWQGYASVDMGGYSPVVPWLFSNGFGYNTALQTTPNEDGVPLLMSYALGLDPTQNQSSRLPKPVVSGGQLRLTFYTGSAGVIYWVEASTNLQSWSTSGITVSAPDSNLFRTASVPLSSGKCFMRIKVAYY